MSYADVSHHHVATLSPTISTLSLRQTDHQGLFLPNIEGLLIVPPSRAIIKHHIKTPHHLRYDNSHLRISKTKGEQH